MCSMNRNEKNRSGYLFLKQITISALKLNYNRTFTDNSCSKKICGYRLSIPVFLHINIFMVDAFFDKVLINYN